MPPSKQRLLDACTDQALEHGLPDRLEPLASAAGTSARMLIYHFGARDALLRAVLAHARQRQLTVFGDLLRVRPDEPYTATPASAWAFMAGPEGQPYLRMFGQWRESAAQQLWPDLRRAATTDWLEPVVRGLLMDLDATADGTRTDRAFADFLGTLECRVRRPRAGPAAPPPTRRARCS